jgi:hypothetical protein
MNVMKLRRFRLLAVLQQGRCVSSVDPAGKIPPVPPFSKGERKTPFKDRFFTGRKTATSFPRKRESRKLAQAGAKRLDARLRGHDGLAITAAFISVLMAPALALAHGGMGPEEIGPPVVTSGLLGFASYWLVMLWPSVKKKEDEAVGVNEQNSYALRTERRVSQRSTRVKRTPRLRKIEGRGQLDGDQNTRRKASDG